MQHRRLFFCIYSLWLSFICFPTWGAESSSKILAEKPLSETFSVAIIKSSVIRAELPIFSADSKSGSKSKFFYSISAELQSRDGVAIPIWAVPWHEEEEAEYDAVNVNDICISDGHVFLLFTSSHSSLFFVDIPLNGSSKGFAIKSSCWSALAAATPTRQGRISAKILTWRNSDVVAIEVVDAPDQVKLHTWLEKKSNGSEFVPIKQWRD